MRKRAIRILGGGPAGLLTARLLARDHPGWEIVVHERLQADETYGFGVALTHPLLAALRAAAPAIHDDLVANSTGFSYAAFRLPQGIAELPTHHAGAISRARMLQLLTERATRAGVRVVIGPAPPVDEVREAADLVIGADGASSPTRERFVQEFGVQEEVGRGVFIWCGAELRLPGNVFVPVETKDGIFVAHAYPYAEGRSTFVIETDEETLRAAGCRTDDFAADGDSDEASLGYLSKAFAEMLGGASFVGNHSRWMRFRTVRCERWQHENVVLLGDAAATAHPSLGSGTKLALEAAIALAQALETVGDEEPASRLEAFETARRPAVERLQDRARRSQLWWESFPSRLHLSPARIAAAYMSRAGAVSLEKLHAAAPSLAAQTVADFARVSLDAVPNGDLGRWALDRPLKSNGLCLERRIIDGHIAPDAVEVNVDFNDPWGERAQELLDGLADGDTPRRVIRLTGDRSRLALLDRLALGERLRTELGAVVAVSVEAELLGDAIDGLVAGRADLVAIGET